MSFSSRRPIDPENDPTVYVDPPEKMQSRWDKLQDDLWAALLEYVGTTIFLLLAFGGVQASRLEANASESYSQIERIMYISICFGFALLVSAWLFYRVTGGLFNPDVSLALLITGLIGPVRFVLYCIAQLLGSITAAAIVLALSPGPLAANTFLAPGVNPAQGVFIEMFTTSILVLAVLMLAAEKHYATPFAPVGIGLTLFMGHMWSVYFTGAGINTARSFGPAVVTGFPYGSQWVYWVGPFLGALLGSAFYTLLKHIKYWRLNPGQDTVDFIESPPNPVYNPKSFVGTVARRRFSRSTDGGARSLRDGRMSDHSETRTMATTTVASENGMRGPVEVDNSGTVYQSGAGKANFSPV